MQGGGFMPGNLHAAGGQGIMGPGGGQGFGIQDANGSSRGPGNVQIPTCLSGTYGGSNGISCLHQLDQLQEGKLVSLKKNMEVSFQDAISMQKYDDRRYLYWVARSNLSISSGMLWVYPKEQTEGELKMVTLTLHTLEIYHNADDFFHDTYKLDMHYAEADLDKQLFFLCRRVQEEIIGTIFAHI